MKKTISELAEDIVNRIPIRDELIVVEASKTPDIFLKAVRFRVRAMRRRARAEALLDYKRSKRSMFLRKTKPDEDVKVTESYLKECVETTAYIQKYRARFARAQEIEEFGKMLLEACRMRRDSIRIIAEAEIVEGMRQNADVERITKRKKLMETAMKLEERRRKFDNEE